MKSPFMTFKNKMPRKIAVLSIIEKRREYPARFQIAERIYEEVKKNVMIALSTSCLDADYIKSKAEAIAFVSAENLRGVVSNNYRRRRK